MAEVPVISLEEQEFNELRKKLVAYVQGKNGRRKGRGFSIGELKAVGLTPEKAVKMGIPVDLRRKTNYEENINTLKSIDLKKLKELAKKFLKRKKVKLGRKHRKRVFRGLTTAGKKARGLLKEKLRRTHKHKWKRKWEE